MHASVRLGALFILQPPTVHEGATLLHTAVFASGVLYRPRWVLRRGGSLFDVELATTTAMTYVRQAAALSARLMAAPLGLRLEGGPLSRLFEATGFELGDASRWTAAHAASFCLLVVAAFEFLSRVVPFLFVRSGAIPARGRHHDVLDWKDTLCLSFNRCASVPFTYHYLKAAWVLPAVKWCERGTASSSSSVEQGAGLRHVSSLGHARLW